MGLRMQPRNEKFFTLFSKAGSNVAREILREHLDLLTKLCAEYRINLTREVGYRAPDDPICASS